MGSEGDEMRGGREGGGSPGVLKVVLSMDGHPEVPQPPSVCFPPWTPCPVVSAKALENYGTRTFSV